jgi:hypothetical protein
MSVPTEKQEGKNLSRRNKEVVQRLLRNLKIELAYDPAILYIRRIYMAIYQMECKSRYNKDICTPMFIEALFT